MRGVQALRSANYGDSINDLIDRDQDWTLHRLISFLANALMLESDGFLFIKRFYSQKIHGHDKSQSIECRHYPAIEREFFLNLSMY